MAAGLADAVETGEAKSVLSAGIEDSVHCTR